GRSTAREVLSVHLDVGGGPIFGSLPLRHQIARAKAKHGGEDDNPSPPPKDARVIADGVPAGPCLGHRLPPSVGSALDRINTIASQPRIPLEPVLVNQCAGSN